MIRRHVLNKENDISILIQEAFHLILVKNHQTGRFEKGVDDIWA